MVLLILYKCRIILAAISYLFPNTFYDHNLNRSQLLMYLYLWVDGPDDRLSHLDENLASSNTFLDDQTDMEGLIWLSSSITGSSPASLDKDDRFIGLDLHLELFIPHHQPHHSISISSFTFYPVDQIRAHPPLRITTMTHAGSPCIQLDQI